MGVREVDLCLQQWQMDARDLRRRTILAPRPRERWYAILLLAQGLTAAATAEALGRDPHTIGRWASAFCEGGPAALIFERATGGAERGGARIAWGGGYGLGQLELEGDQPVCGGPVRHQPEPHQLLELPPSTRGQALHRLGFAFKRPKKRLLKADETKREAFVVEYAALARGAKQSGGKIFFADEAHFQADAELRGKWVLRGEPALVDSTSPRYGEKASYYSAVCLETGEVDWMELEGNSNAGTSETFLRQLRERHLGPLSVIWDNAPAPLRLTQE